MLDSVSIPSEPFEDPAMDFEFLRRRGIQFLEQWVSKQWTDFNTHDPGITILEQVCYALTDLAYRTQYSMQDLLADDELDPYASLYAPLDILTSSPVTKIDWRKKLLDIEGVQNAWIEPVLEPSLALHFHREKRQIDSKASELRETEPLFLRGLYRIFIERSDAVDRDSAELEEAVYQCVHANRALGEDFESITLLAKQNIQIDATIVVDKVEDAEALLADIYYAIDHYFSPSIRYYSLPDMLADGFAIEDIFNGPALKKGFIKDGDLQKVERKSELRTSDIIREVMDVAGVKSIISISLLSNLQRQQWVLPLADNQVPKLDIVASSIQFVKNKLLIEVDTEKAAQLYWEKRIAAAAVKPLTYAERSPKPPKGIVKQLSHYDSIMHQFPDTFAINANGLPSGATPQRRAQAKQLKAYLLFFDQLLANQFAQLSHAKDLFSFHHQRNSSYFSSLLNDPELIQHQLYQRSLKDHAQRLGEITEAPSSTDNTREGSHMRHNRFLDHLLARFAEQFTDYSLTLYGALNTTAKNESIDSDLSPAQKLIEDKQAFLKDYPFISAARGKAYNYLLPKDENNCSGLELRLLRKMGITNVAERFILVEHILLRPIEADSDQQTPLLGHSALKDPYSLQLSIVFPDNTLRYQNLQFKQFVEQTVRNETPAHLGINILWLDAEPFSQFRTIYADWLHKRRVFWQRKGSKAPIFSEGSSAEGLQ